MAQAGAEARPAAGQLPHQHTLGSNGDCSHTQSRGRHLENFCARLTGRSRRGISHMARCFWIGEKGGQWELLSA
eukprot:1159123-Pelagomonas_calceolata.AAC.13